MAFTATSAATSVQLLMLGGVAAVGAWARRRTQRGG